MTRLYIVTCLLNLYAEYIVRNARLNHKLKSRLLVEISTTSDMLDESTQMAESGRGTKEPLDEGEREE